MNITVYDYGGNPKNVSKSLSSGTTYSGHLHSRTNDLKISVALRGVEWSTVDSINYAYVDTTGKYYFVESKDFDNNEIILNLKQDVLMSFSSGIRNASGTVARNENRYNGYMLDNSYQVLSYKNIVTKEFPNGVGNESIILMTVG